MDRSPLTPATQTTSCSRSMRSPRCSPFPWGPCATGDTSAPDRTGSRSAAGSATAESTSAPGSTPSAAAPLPTDQAAEYRNVPARWIADAVRQRKVRCTRIGKTHPVPR